MTFSPINNIAKFCMLQVNSTDILLLYVYVLDTSVYVYELDSFQMNYWVSEEKDIMVYSMILSVLYLPN